MRFIQAVILVLSLFALQNSEAQQAAKPMTNRDVITLVSLEIGDSIILERIRTAKETNFTTDIESLRTLRAGHVSPEVIQAMRVARRSGARTASAQPKAPDAVRTPPVCNNNPLCREGDNIAATVTHFDYVSNIGPRWLSLTLRVRNKTTRTLELGAPIEKAIDTNSLAQIMAFHPTRRYSEIADDQRSTYSLFDFVGIAPDYKSIHPALELAPGESGEIRIAFAQRNANDAFGTVFSLRLDLDDRGTTRFARSETTVAAFELNFDHLEPGFAELAPASDNGHCLTYSDCYDGGSFVAAVTRVLKAPGRLKFTVTYTNVSTANLVLFAQENQENAFDELHNRIGGSARIKGLPTGSAVAPLAFVLLPGQSKDATFTFECPKNLQTGTKYSLISRLKIVQPGLGRQLAFSRDVPVEFNNLDVHTSPASVTAGPAVAAASEKCKGTINCVDAGSYLATVDGLSTGSLRDGTFMVSIRIRFTNSKPTAIRLGYREGGSASDEMGNDYYIRGVETMGVVGASGIDPTFKLEAGASRVVTFGLGANGGNANQPRGSTFNFDPEIFELTIMPNGEQVSPDVVTLLSFSGMAVARASTPTDRRNSVVSGSGSSSPSAAAPSPRPLTPAVPGTRGALKQAIEARFSVTEINGSDPTVQGIAFTLLKDDLTLGSTTPVAPMDEATSTYRKGKFEAALFTRINQHMAVGYTRNFVAGEGLWLIGVDVRDDAVVLEFLSEVINATRYKGYVRYPFTKAHLPAPDAMLQLIAETIQAAGKP
jgi:hypothetical protein